MKTRIQPEKVKVPPNEPFKNDLLDRERVADVLTKVVDRIEGPCVLAVDAVWGAGKTTFIDMWAKHLRRENFLVLEFNAWKTDFSEEPFIDLFIELTEFLKKEDQDKSLKSNIKKLTKAARKIIQESSSVFIPHTLEYIPCVGPLLSKLLGRFIKKRLSQSQKKEKSPTEFKKILEEATEKLSISRYNKPLIVMIDELDRCRPTYAVELLEAAKHLFLVDHIVFVLVVNRSELEHSVKALYGREFDARGYLRRFFDLDFRLPDPEREEFIEELFKKRGLNNHLSRTKHMKNIKTESKELIQRFFGSSYLSIRQIAQAIHRLELVLMISDKVTDTFPLATIVALIIRTIDTELYHQFINGNVSDHEIVENVYKSLGVDPLEEATRDCHLLFEETLARAWQEITDGNTSELLQNHKKLFQASALIPQPPLDVQFAKRFMDNMRNGKTRGTANLGCEFKIATERLELLFYNT